MKTLTRTAYMLVFLLLAKFSFCQEPKISDKIADKVVIGFPDISNTQLNQIKAKFVTYDQILTAKYIYGDHNCMLITFDSNVNEFSVYGELLKTINEYYDTGNCYFKVPSAYAEILSNIGSATVFEIK